MKYPVVITYRHTKDFGEELRYSLRSLVNIANWNGQVFIIGDRESWFKNINYIPLQRHRNSYIDQEYAMLTAIMNERLADDFIYSMDDVYITEKIGITNMHQGVFNPLTDRRGYHRNQKMLTVDWLRQNDHSSLDYELHTPMILNKAKRMEVHNILQPSMAKTIMKPRTLYGNIFNIGGEYYEDKKTRTAELPQGKIISTRFYTPELAKIFPEPSKYEIM